MANIDYMHEDISDLDPPLEKVTTWPNAPVVAPPPPPKPPIVQPRAALDIPEDAMYGWAAEHARTLEAPMGWSYTSILTLMASRRILTGDMYDAVRPTLYTMLIGPPEDGKSLTYKRAIRSLGLQEPFIYKGVPSSDRGLEEILAQEPPAGHKRGDPIVKELFTKTIVMDEARTLLNKMAIQGSSLATVLCTMWSEDDASSAVKGHKINIFARISMLGALACQDRDEFALLFGAETMAGLYSRYVIVPGPTRWKFSQKWKPIVEVRRPSVVTIPDEAYDMVEEWRDSNEAKKRGRIGEIALRVALISAAANHDCTLTPECMTAALKFAEWQERVKAIYSASPALNEDAQITGAILDALAEEDGDFIMFRDLIHKKNWGRKFGSPKVNRVKFSLIDEGIIVGEPERDEENMPIPGKYTGRVALNAR